jgi:protoheme IX farnesyltransferase
MSQEKIQSHTSSASLRLTLKVKDYFQLMKFTLSFTVVFCCVVCFLLSPYVVMNADTLLNILLLFIAGLLVTGSANALNQVSEKDTDALMKRTSNRPIAANRMRVEEGYTFAVVTGVVGVLMLYFFFNFMSAFLSALSLFIYAFIYTPLKKKSSLSVLVGAFPGAFPNLIGWIAGFPPGVAIEWGGGLALFFIQFLWQFPHFWAIAWVAYNDYNKAGFRLLPSAGGPTKYTALQTIIYSFLMLPVGMLPYYLHISGEISFWIVAVCNIILLIQCIRLFIEMNVTAARRVMFTSYIYLPIVLLSLLADKVA